jgi:hypothetical protein
MQCVIKAHAHSCTAEQSTLKAWLYLLILLQLPKLQHHTTSATYITFWMLHSLMYEAIDRKDNNTQQTVELSTGWTTTLLPSEPS